MKKKLARKNDVIDYLMSMNAKLKEENISFKKKLGEGVEAKNSNGVRFPTNAKIIIQDLKFKEKEMMEEIHSLKKKL